MLFGNRFALAATLALAAYHCVAPAQEQETAQAIVAKADAIRLPRENYQVEVEIVTQSAGRDAEQRKYRVLSKGSENAVVLTLEPASERGQAMLAKGRDLWIFLPAVSQPVRLSLSQRLTGQVANGDLARANFADDYTATLLKTEDIDGEPHQLLELIAVDKSVTYRRVLYWVRAADSRPYKAEFYSLSDRLLKTCVYKNYQRLGGQMRPTRLVMEDALKKGDQSVLNYSDMQVKELADKIFTKDYLKKLEF